MTTVTPAASSSREAVRPDKTLLTAWLLLALDERATYGYRLRRDLDAHGVSIDPGRMYRRLRALEQYGWVQSRWISSIGGPRRRLYRLTPKGRRMLDEVAGLIKAIRDTHDAFVQAHGGLRAPAPSSRYKATRPGKQLLTAWLLLLLDRDESHGYELGGRLAEERLAVDPTVLYQTLRTVEHDRCLASRWGKSVAGPRRHIYELAPEGRRKLGELAGVIRARRGCMNTFLQTHEHGRGQRPQAPTGGRQDVREHLKRHR